VRNGGERQCDGEKGGGIYIAPVCKHLDFKAMRSGIDHTVLPANNTVPASISKHSPDVAATDYGGRHLIAAYYSFVDPKRTKG